MFFFLPALILIFFSTSWEIGWIEHLRYDICSVKSLKWDAKPLLSQSSLILDRIQSTVDRIAASVGLFL